MTASADPAVVAQSVCAGVSRLISGGLNETEREEQLDALAACYAEHTDVRHPFAPGGESPLYTRAELRRHFAAAPGRDGAIERFDVVGFRAHQTEDPEVVITEFRYEGSASGRPFTLPNIFVIRVRDGVITESRDYADHVAAARAFGATLRG